MALTSGTRLGPYEIISAVGSGGMGEVYRARDTKLGREVAVKLLLSSVSTDPARLARFSREAQVLAALNHPNIAQIYGVEETVHGPALVLELVGGPTLAERVAQGPVPLAEALSIARQIADALDAAHEQGIIHRDLKPANVKLSPNGAVKVLDFGLAKVAELSGGAAELQFDAPTSPVVTHEGVILGTASYMSPEQAEGKAVDRRTDLWAFGVVLLEMLTGRRVFSGDTLTQVLASVLRAEPDWSSMPPETPAAIRRLLRRCLQKDRNRRLSCAADARLEIEEALTTPAYEPESSIPHSASRWRRALMFAAPLALLVAVAAPTAMWFALRPKSPPAIQFEIAPPAAAPLNVSGAWRDLAISPDGSRLAYTVGARQQLIVRKIDSTDSVPLRGVTRARNPFFSPDGRWLGFFTGVSGELRKIPIEGGPPVSLCRFSGSPRGATWVSDEFIIFATNEPTTGLLRVSAAGGEPEMLSTPQSSEADHYFPSVLPGGHAALFTIGSAGGGGVPQIAVLDLRTRKVKTLIRAGSDAAYVDEGYLLYGTADGVRSVAFDPLKLELLSDPVPLVDVRVSASGASNFAVARNGTMAFIPAGPAAPGRTATPVLVNRLGDAEPLPLPPRPYGVMRISPDGKRVAVSIADQEHDIWTWDFERQTLTRLTFNPSRDWYPSWSPDGKRIAFVSTRAGAPHIFIRPADGTGTDEQLTGGTNLQYGAASFSPDGTRLAFTGLAPGTGEDVVMLSLSTKRLEALVQTNFAERNPAISPDGRWLAYESNESGQEEIHVRPFPKVSEGRWEISSGGGTDPVWSRDGNELFYRDFSAVKAVSVQAAATFSAGSPTTIIDGPYAVGLGATFDVTDDGRKFLMLKEPESTSPPKIVVTLNWLEQLKAKMRTPE